MTDSKKLAEELREAAKRADYFQTGEQGLLNRAAEVIGALSAHTPTDDELLDAFAQHYLVPDDDPDFERGSLLAGLRAVAALRRSEVPEPSAERLDYYDPARQDRISEHDCVFEDGEWWFGHGMPCKHPKLHPEPQGEPSDARVLDDAEALRDLLDEMNEAGVMPELPFRDAQDIAGVAYLVDEGDTTRAVFLSDPGEDRVQYDGRSEDDASYVGLFERPIDELHGPIAVLRAAGGAR